MQVIAYHKAVASAQQSSVQHSTTGPYAVPTKTADNNKDQGVSISIIISSLS